MPDDLDDAKLEQLLFPKIVIAQNERPKLDFKTMCERLKEKGVTLGLEWERYKQEYPESGYSYPQFCALYREWNKTVNVVMRQNHKAGEKPSLTSLAKHCLSSIGIPVKYIKLIYSFVLLVPVTIHTPMFSIRKMQKPGVLVMPMLFNTLMAAQK